MKLIIEIPKEFEAHFENDRFSDSLGRAYYDICGYAAISGKYERETILMLREALKNAEVVENDIQ